MAGAGLAFPASADDVEVDVVQRVEGNGTTAFGAPAIVVEADRRPLDAGEAERLGALVAAAWAEFDRVVDAAPAELRKGPRGGGRDTAKIVDHVAGAEDAYAGKLGLRDRPKDRLVLRAELTALLAAPSDGSPPPGGSWPQRYGARRVAWHVLDHAWEIQDRSDLSDR